MKGTVYILAGISFLLIFSISCGNNKDGGDNSGAQNEQGKIKPVAKKKIELPEKGVEVAKKILSTFDEAVLETAEILKEKPTVDSVRPSLDKLFEKYSKKMQLLNKEYLALKDEDIRLFGSANGYLGENRGKHVFKRYSVFNTLMSHYKLSKNDQYAYDFMNKKLIDLLEIAVKR